MSNNFPEELKYTSSHEWIRKDLDGTLVVGITDYAQDALGEVVFIELPDEESIKIASGDDLCVIESVKSASDVYSPVSGELTAINTALVDAPSLINSDPYGDGWLFKISPSDIVEYNELLTPEDYKNGLLEENGSDE